MRDLFLSLVQDTDTGRFSVAQELPYDVDGIALYVKNARRIYVSMPTTTQEELYYTLDNMNIAIETTEITLYFTVEAKTVAGYDDAITNLKTIRDHADLKSMGYARRRVNVTSRYESNLLITELTYQFSKIL
jgi:hypothetical protein